MSVQLLFIGPKDEPGLFNCSLKTVDLKDSLFYYALPYTWAKSHALGREGHAFTKHYEAANPEYASSA
jgi:hypothetical protein